MNRLVTFTLCSALLLSACAKKSDLAPEEVLRKSAQAVGQLQSASFVFNGDVATPAGVLFTGHADGVMQHGGKQFQFALILHGSYPANGVTHTLEASADVAVASSNEIYFRLRSLSVTPPQEAFSASTIDQIKGAWWKLPSDMEKTENDVAPQPALLQLQSQVMKITEDLGIQPLSGRDAYHYKVMLDPEKFIAFLQASASAKGEAFDQDTAKMMARLFTGTGELWIDHDTTFIHRLEWMFESQEVSLPATVHANVELSKYNTAEPIVFPQDAKPWELGSLMPKSSMYPVPARSKSSSSSRSLQSNTSSTSSQQ